MRVVATTLLCSDQIILATATETYPYENECFLFMTAWLCSGRYFHEEEIPWFGSLVSSTIALSSSITAKSSYTLNGKKELDLRNRNKLSPKYPRISKFLHRH
jgi:hypothetical protein